MGNIMTSIYTGVSGIQVNQTGMNVTGHNLANVNTKGYVRQQMLGKDFTYQTIGSSAVSAMQVGYGTSVDAVRQVREQFIDKSYRLESGRYGFYHVQSEAVNEIETIMGEVEGEAFHVEIEDFWTSLQELVKEPNSIVKRAAFISTATSLIERAEAVQDALGKYQLNLNSEIKIKVNRINEIGHEIHKLNQQIQRFEIGSQNANDYRDTRNALLDELGELVKFSYREDAYGVVTINIEGRQFLTDSGVFQLATKELDNKSGLLDVVWEKSMDVPVFNLDGDYSSEHNTNVGSLKGLLIVRGDSKANYSQVPNRKDFDTPAAYEEALEKYNNSIGSSAIKKVQAQFDNLIHGLITEINDIFSPNTGLEQFMDDFNLSPITDNKVQLLIEGEEQPREIELPVKGILVWDEFNAPVGSDNERTPREALFNRKHMDRYTKAQITCTEVDDNGNQTIVTKDVYIYNQEDSDNYYSLFTLGEIEVNPNVLQDVSKLPMNGTSNTGLQDAYDMKVCEKLSSIFNKKFAPIDPNELIDYSYSDYYTALVGDIATTGQAFQTMSDKQNDMRETIDNQRQQVMGVSSDEELTNLIRYQHGYNASSKYIAVINEMLDTIINGMG